MPEREICGICQGPWPCECSPSAAPVVLMASVDDDFAADIAKRMRNSPDAPLTVSAYEPEPSVRVDLGYGDGRCGHYKQTFEINPDKRIVWCRECGAVLDPYEVIRQLAIVERRVAERLKAAQELERREREREEERKARAKVRRHRYANYSPRSGTTKHCATCGGAETDDVHTKEPK